MSRIVPAIKGRMGDMDYYILTLKAGTLNGYVRTPRELPGWEDLSLEEQYQRDINLKRVKAQIAPYWATHPSHFFGSIIVTPSDFGGSIANDFEPIGEIATKNLPRLYRETAQNIGFLTIPDEIILVPLDGQHRVKAIQFAIDGQDSEGNKLDFAPNPELAHEDISVLLVAVDTKKARSIFTHVNRYAKPTSTGQNLITSDDDILAVIAREIANDIISARLVKYATNTLTPKDKHFTTLSTIYNCMDAIAKSHLPSKIDITHLPDKSTQGILRTKAEEIWEVLLSKIDGFSDAIANREEDGDEERREIRKSSLLGRPVTQECLFRAFLKLTKSKTSFSNDEAAESLNRLPWAVTDENIQQFWNGVLWSGDAEKGRMVTKNRNLASDLIFYLAGGRMGDEEKGQLLEKYQALFTADDKPDSLPPRL